MFYFWKATDSSEEEDNIIGPMPAKGPVESDVTQEFERRAQRMKEKLTSADSVSWIFSLLIFGCWCVFVFFFLFAKTLCSTVLLVMPKWLSLLIQRKRNDGFCWKLRDSDCFGLVVCLCFLHLRSFVKDEPKQVTRESWMTELPPELKSFGFGPRTFKRRAEDRSGDRSVWTDTPADRERKAKVSIYSLVHVFLYIKYILSLCIYMYVYEKCIHIHINMNKCSHLCNVLIFAYTHTHTYCPQIYIQVVFTFVVGIL